MPSFLSVLLSVVRAVKAQIQGLPFLCLLASQRIGRKQFARKALENRPSVSKFLFSLPATSDSFATPWTLAPIPHPPGSSVRGNFLGENAGVGCHFLQQGVVPTQGLDPRLLGLLPWQVYSLPLSHLGSLHVSYTCFSVRLAQYSQIMSMSMAIRERLGAVEEVLKAS